MRFLHRVSASDGGKFELRPPDGLSLQGPLTMPRSGHVSYLQLPFSVGGEIIDAIACSSYGKPVANVSLEARIWITHLADYFDRPETRGEARIVLEQHGSRLAPPMSWDLGEEPLPILRRVLNALRPVEGEELVAHAKDVCETVDLVVSRGTAGGGCYLGSAEGAVGWYLEVADVVWRSRSPLQDLLGDTLRPVSERIGLAVAYLREAERDLHTIDYLSLRTKKLLSLDSYELLVGLRAMRAFIMKQIERPSDDRNGEWARDVKRAVIQRIAPLPETEAIRIFWNYLMKDMI